MMKLVAGGIVFVGAVAASFVMAGARQEVSSRPASAPSAVSPALASSRPADAKSPTTKPANASDAKNVEAALRQAADAKKHLFVFVYENDNEQTRAGRKTFDAAVSKLGDAVQWIAVNRGEPAESDFVKKYGLKAAPMPLVLSFAPNGAIVGGFVGARLTEQQLAGALASTGMQACLKALQDRKLVFLCLQNGATKSNDTAMKGVNEFKADERFAQATEIVKVDPSDVAEKNFMAQLEIDPKVEQATTIFLAPPGSIVGKFAGETNKDGLVTALQKASSGCGAGGCGPKGCGPRK